jgi:hypothetical protein
MSVLSDIIAPYRPARPRPPQGGTLAGLAQRMAPATPSTGFLQQYGAQTQAPATPAPTPTPNTGLASVAQSLANQLSTLAPTQSLIPETNRLESLAAPVGVESITGIPFGREGRGRDGREGRTPMDLGVMAGAVIEGDLTPENLKGGPSGVELQKPALRSLWQVRRATGLPIFGNISSSYRTQSEQAALYAAKPGIAAPPGQSLHQQGLAIDVDSGWLAAHPEIRQALLSSGWHQFDPQREPWHFSYGQTG